MDGATLGFAALGVAALLYIAGIIYALRGDGVLAMVLIIGGAALTLFSAQ